jgi:hypothetical protein
MSRCCRRSRSALPGNVQLRAHHARLQLKGFRGALAGGLRASGHPLDEGNGARMAQAIGLRISRGMTPGSSLLAKGTAPFAEKRKAPVITRAFHFKWSGKRDLNRVCGERQVGDCTLLSQHRRLVDSPPRSARLRLLPARSARFRPRNGARMALTSRRGAVDSVCGQWILLGWLIIVQKVAASFRFARRHVHGSCFSDRQPSAPGSLTSAGRASMP